MSERRGEALELGRHRLLEVRGEGALVRGSENVSVRGNGNEKENETDPGVGRRTLIPDNRIILTRRQVRVQVQVMAQGMILDDPMTLHLDGRIARAAPALQG